MPLPCLFRISVKHSGDFSNFHFPFTFFLYASHSLFSLPKHFSLPLTMAQVAVSRSIQGTLLCPSSGSARDRSQNLLKPPSFASTVLPPHGNNNKRSQVAPRSFQISARKSAPSEVIPVSPEDDPKVRVFCFFIFSLDGFSGSNCFDPFCVVVIRLSSICNIYAGCSHLGRIRLGCGRSPRLGARQRSCVPLDLLPIRRKWFGSWLRLVWTLLDWICLMGTMLLIRKSLTWLRNIMLKARTMWLQSCLTLRLVCFFEQRFGFLYVCFVAILDRT